MTIIINRSCDVFWALACWLEKRLLGFPSLGSWVQRCLLDHDGDGGRDKEEEFVHHLHSITVFPGQHLPSPLPAHAHAALLATLARHQVGIVIVVLVTIACVAFIMSIITIIMIIRQPWRPVMCNNMLHLPSPSLLTSSKQLDFLISLPMGEWLCNIRLIRWLSWSLPNQNFSQLIISKTVSSTSAPRQPVRGGQAKASTKTTDKDPRPG